MRLNDLPDWQKLLKLIGEEDAAALSAVYGGGRIYVPTLAGPHHPITVAIGPELAARVVAEFGGGHIDAPISLGKKATILQLLKGGASVPMICRRVGVSRRHVFYLKDELKGGPGRAGDRKGQRDLFG